MRSQVRFSDKELSIPFREQLALRGLVELLRKMKLRAPAHRRRCARPGGTKRGVPRTLYIRLGVAGLLRQHHAVQPRYWART
ncbi:MAG: hypothetical protein R2810_10905 [Flavobacteriales bacterium]